MIKNYLKIFFSFFLSFAPIPILGTEYFFFIQFTDKNNTIYTLDNPLEYLSDRAIERRRYFRIECDSTDLPVNYEYVKHIEQTGVKVWNKSKWLNGITIITPDSSIIESVNQLPFVLNSEYTGKRDMNIRKTEKKSNALPIQDIDTNSPYGLADAQIEQIKGKYLHENGYRGNDIYIGVLDAGFFEVNSSTAYNLLFLQNRMLGTKDFVEEDSDVYEKHYHGAHVLSTMAANIPSTYIGTAPDASYWLIRTEDTRSEYPAEMDFWISGVEFADSAGIDIINSSLGYTVFDEKNLSLTYEDMNGQKTRISKAAELASKKGIIVVSAAGNEGNKNFKKISAPADAKGILTVGGVDINNNPSTFSSHGPSFDGRLKPEIVARATNTVIMNKYGTAENNGTSFASPIIAGMMACFLQAAKEHYSYISLEDLYALIFENANSFSDPNERIGYGLPDFEKSTRLLTTSTQQNITIMDYVSVYTDSMAKKLHINLSTIYNYTNFSLQIYSSNGELIISQPFSQSSVTINTTSYPRGLYAVRIINAANETQTEKILIY